MILRWTETPNLKVLSIKVLGSLNALVFLEESVISGVTKLIFTPRVKMDLTSGQDGLTDVVRAKEPIVPSFG